MVDAMRLARGMTYKYAAVGRDLGGGKAVIIGDPRKDKSEALLRELTWKRAFASAKSLRQIFPLSVSPSDIIRLLGSVGL